MTINRTFTDASDEFAVTADGIYDLSFLGGADRLVVSAGAVTAHMGSGNDRVRIDGGYGNFWGQSGDDRFNIYSSGNHVDAGSGNDTLEIGGSNNVLSGHDGDDLFRFTRNANDVVLQGGDGNDSFNGNSHSIGGTIFGGLGNDSFLMFGNHGGWTVSLRGGPGDDSYRIDPASPPTIVEFANEGTETVHVAAGMDYTLPANVENLIVGTFATAAGEGRLTGNDLDNLIDGSSASDIISGLEGNDRLFGGADADVIDGGAGADRIYGGLGADTLTGGAGTDTFVYTSLQELSTVYGAENITDWEPADRIDISAIDANSLIAGNQSFQFAGYSFGNPPPAHEAGTLYLGGFGGDLWIIGFTDDDSTPDLLINLWSNGGEAALTNSNIVF